MEILAERPNLLFLVAVRNLTVEAPPWLPSGTDVLRTRERYLGAGDNTPDPNWSDAQKRKSKLFAAAIDAIVAKQLQLDRDGMFMVNGKIYKQNERVTALYLKLCIIPKFRLANFYNKLLLSFMILTIWCMEKNMERMGSGKHLMHVI